MLTIVSRHHILLVLIVIVALAIRLMLLDSIPYGAHIDEASLGYNAYSIAETGKDEFGKTMPMIFQAYGDQKLPSYIYATAGITKFFGLSNFTTRLAGVIGSCLLVIFTYLLLRVFKFSENVSLFGSLVTATSPWLIMLSRVFGYESGFGLLFYTIGLWSAFSMLTSKRKNLFLIIAVVAFGLTLYSYLAYRLITVLTLISFVMLFMRARTLISSRGVVLILAFCISIFPIVLQGFKGDGFARASQTMSTSLVGMTMTINDNRSICAKSVPKIICYLSSNKFNSYAYTVMRGYASVLFPQYLFIDGDVDANYVNVDEYGLMSLVIMPLYLVGLYYLTKKLLSGTVTKQELFVFMGLIITPIPTVLLGVAQQVRLSGMFPFILMTCMYGVDHVSQLAKYDFIKKNFLYVLGICTLISTGFFMVNFLYIHTQKYEETFQTPIAKLMQYLGREKNASIYIRGINEAIVLYAYYNAYDPRQFQANVIRPAADSGGFSHATDLKDIHRTDMSFEQTFCTHTTDSDFLYSTNELVQLPGVKLMPVHTIYSRDKVHELYYVYDSRIIDSKLVDCKVFRE